MIEFTIVIPGWPESVNQRYRIGAPPNGHAHMYVTKGGKRWQLDAGNMVSAEANRQRVQFQRRKEYTIDMHFYVPRGRLYCMDVDGVVKPVIDTVSKALGLNDAYVRRECAEMTASEDGEWRVEVTVAQE